MKTNLWTLCLFFALSLPLQAAKYHVVATAPNGGNGLSWSAAFKNPQQAFDVAVKGDTVWVAAGTYLPVKKYADFFKNNTPTTERDRSFIIQDSILVMGGFPANPTDAAGLSSRDWLANRTVLSGDFNGDDDPDNSTTLLDNARHVVILIGASPKLILDGFFIQNGVSDAPETAYYNGERKYPVIYGCGGGIYCSTNDKVQSPTLRNLYVHSNFADYEGGGLYLVSEEFDASPAISNVTFMNNQVSLSSNGGGGGLLVEGRWNNARLENVVIMGNSAGTKGGGAYFKSTEACKPELQNTLIAGNYSLEGGGGAYFNSWLALTEPVLTNVTVSGNAVSPYRTGETNRSLDGGGLMVTSTLGDVNLVVRNTAICDNLGFAYVDIFLAGGEGKMSSSTYLNSYIRLADINTDPMFAAPADAQNAPTGNQWFDYLPKLGSPLINRGDNRFVTTARDLNGNARIFGGTVDIGAYESQGINPPELNENISSETNVWASAGRLYVKTNAVAALKIYSVSGTLVRQINSLAAGTYSCELPRGIYFVKTGNGKAAKVAVTL